MRATKERFRAQESPRVFRLSKHEALDVRRSPTGDVGRLFTGEGLELVWVSKKGEALDSHWFEYSLVDLLLVLKGRLRVVFENRAYPRRTLVPLDLLVLPAGVRCRAYRWPRTTTSETIFLAAYPIPGRASPKPAPLRALPRGRRRRTTG